MHLFLRSAGFSQYKKQTDIEELLTMLQNQYMDTARSCINEYGEECLEIRAEVAENIGITIFGVRDSNGEFHRQYYAPYVASQDVTTLLPVMVDRHVDDRSLKASVEDGRIGVSLIFSLDNTLDYLALRAAGKVTADKPIEKAASKLAAFSTDGKILLPSLQESGVPTPALINGRPREALISAAKNGDQLAMEELAMNDMNLMQEMDERLRHEDMYSIVDQCVMPQGIECDIYLVLGRILHVDIKKNNLTGEEIYDLTIMADETTFHVAINAADLMGEPVEGRRFKGMVWMMGRVDFLG